MLQKKDSEGFGFVLRGAKGECRLGRVGRRLSNPASRAGTPTHPPPHSRVLVPQLWGGLCDLGLSPIPCSASPPPPLRPRRLLPVCSADPHRGVHPHSGLPGTAVPGVCGRGGRGMAGWTANGRLPYRGESWLAPPSCTPRDKPLAQASLFPTRSWQPPSSSSPWALTAPDILCIHPSVIPLSSSPEGQSYPPVLMGCLLPPPGQGAGGDSQGTGGMRIRGDHSGGEGQGGAQQRRPGWGP